MTTEPAPPSDLDPIRLRHSYADAFITLVMDGAVEVHPMDVHHRAAIILALQDAAQFFATPEFGTEIS